MVTTLLTVSLAACSAAPGEGSGADRQAPTTSADPTTSPTTGATTGPTTGPTTDHSPGVAPGVAPTKSFAVGVRKIKVNRDGTLTVVIDGLNQPTSLEFIKNTAYVVTLGGEIWKIKGVSR